MKISFYTYADKRPDFIELQYKSLSHFMKNDFELIVINNCPWYAFSRKNKIDTECKKIGIKCIRAGKMNHFNPAIACAVPIQWSFHHLINKNENISCIIDSDMFLIQPLDMYTYMQDFDIAAVKQRRGHVNYLWNGLMFFNLKTLPNKDAMNFMCGTVEGERVDVGGYLYYWINKNKNVKIKNILHTSHIFSGNNNLHCLPEKIRSLYNEDFRFEIYDKLFLHYGRGSNWDKNPKDYHTAKTALLHSFVEGMISGETMLPDYSYVFDPDAWNVKK